MQRLGQEAERLFPLPTHEDALRQWLDRARLLRPMQANVDRTRESLAASTEDPAMQLAPDDLAFLHQSLQALAEQFAAFFGRSGLVAEVEKRLVRATTLVRRSVEAPAAEWANAIAMVAGSPRYGGLKLSPQVGLVPIGHDPDSGFAEFAVLDTGELPARRDGRLIVTLRSAIVLVLLPGGVARIGAVNSPGDPRHDPDASSQEGPVHEVRLDPFFIGKCELTQGQWLAMTGKNPSYYSRSLNFGVTDRHPATNLAQDVCDQNLCRFDLTLPTEVQWEYACRAGTDTPWWTGADREGLRENGIAANLADQTAKRRGATWPPIAEWPDYDDRHVIQAPVGLLLPNPFGLHDVHGNVWEWCLDDGGRYGLDEPRPGDGYRQSRATDLRQSRGGAFSYGAQAARSSSRNAVAKNSAGDMDGARVARSLRAP
jgi:formylglycine-generating enzyme required for sulfatase activity